MLTSVLKTSLIILLQFMDSLTSTEGKPNQVRMPEQCEGRNYCMIKPKDYPQEQMKKILSNLNVKTVEPDWRLSQRLGGDETESICERVYKVDPIYEIIDQSGDVRYVAQLENRFMQKHAIVECKNPGRVEKLNVGSLFDDYQLQQYNVSCVETRLAVHFLVLRHDENGVELASPMGGIPACCSCRYSDPVSRQ